uniref:Uncharacterized protein n=1 Tax=Glossina pallidipes TaxID=7398 RepID=A0A1A9Z249_GLOPL
MPRQLNQHQGFHENDASWHPNITLPRVWWRYRYYKLCYPTQLEHKILLQGQDVHRKRITPILLTPQQFKEELSRIIPHVPPSRQSPQYQGNLFSLYKLISLQLGITERQFKFTNPLTGSDVLNLYQLTLMLYQLNDTLVAIKLSTDFLAVNCHQDRYFPTSTTNLEKCTESTTKSVL